MSERSSTEWLMQQERKSAYKEEAKRIKKTNKINRILKGITQGETLKSLCEENSVLVEMFYRWIHESPELEEEYALARKVQAEVLRDEVLSISDQEDDPDNPHSVNRDRLRVGSRQWLMARANPERYGEKTQIESKITGGTNIQVNLVTLTQQLKELPLGQKLLECINMKTGEADGQEETNISQVND